MKRKALLARVLIGLSGKNQNALAGELGVHRSLLGHFQQGRVEPALNYLERLASAAGLTLAQAEEILRLYQGFRRTHNARARSAEEVLDGLTRSVRTIAETIYRRVIPLPVAEVPSPVDRELAQQSAERQEATAELARKVLSYLFRARHDQGLRFTP